MDAENKHFGHIRPLHRLLKFLQVTLIGLLCAAAAVYGVGFFAVAPIARAKIERLCGGAAAVQSGRFTGVGAVCLKGIVVGADAESVNDSEILRADRIDVRFEPWDLLKGRFTVRSVTLTDFLLTADYDSIGGGWNLGRLTFGKTASGPQKIMPLIQVRRGAVRIRQLMQNTPQTITTIGLNGDIAVQTGRHEYSFALQTDGRFGFGDSKLQGVLTVGQEGRQSRFAAAGHIRMPQARVLDNAWNMEDIQLECTFDAQTILVQRCGFSMKGGRADISGLIHLTGRRPMDLKISTQGLSLSDHYVPDTIVCSEPVRAMLDPSLRRFLARYHAAGRGDIEATIRGHLDDLSGTQIDGVIRCLDISVKDENFPYAVDRIQGEIELAGRGLRLNNLKGRHGDMALLFNGTVDNFGPQAAIDLRTTSDTLRFDDALYNALSDSVKRIWLMFKPQGLMGVDYHFRRAPDGQKAKTLSLHLKDTSAVYTYFPYLLENLTGTITMEAGRIQFSQVTARYEDGRSVILNGQVLGLQTDEPAFDIHVRGERIPVDKKLIEAMSVEQQALFDQLEIEGRADLDIRVFSDPAEKKKPDYIAEIRLDGSRLLYKGFPLEMTDVHLSADVTKDAAILHTLEGQTESGRVALSGKVYPAGVQPSRAGFCLELDAKAFDLNDAFWKAVGGESAQKSGKLKMTGKVDAVGHLAFNLPEAVCGINDLAIDCRDNPVEWGGSVLGRSSGRLRFLNEGVEFSEFQLRDIPVESLPQDLMSEKIRALYGWARPQGTAHLRIHHGQMWMQSQRPLRMEMDAEVELADVSCGVPERISQLDGVFDGRLAGDFQTHRWEVLTHYRIDRLQYSNRFVTELTGQAIYDPNTMQLSSDDLAARLYDGTVKGRFQVNLAPQAQTGYMLKLECRDVNAQKLLKAQQPEDPQKQTQGQVSGEMALEGDFQNLAEPRGRLAATVVDMKMGRQSLPGKILTAVQLRRPEEFIFSRMEINGVIRGAELILDNVLMVGDPLVFRGKGVLDMQQRQIAMELTAWNRLGRGDTSLDRLLQGVGSALWRVEVRGDMKEPDIQAVFLSVFRPPF